MGTDPPILRKGRIRLYRSKTEVSSLEGFLAKAQSLAKPAKNSFFCFAPLASLREIFLLFPEGEKLTGHKQQAFRVERLGDVDIRFGLQTAVPILWHVFRCQKSDERILCNGIFLQN